jgi:catechol 2,3-dioxygenase-like lactoylglutathione lyase family enzyme/chorismate mutase
MTSTADHHEQELSRIDSQLLQLIGRRLALSRSAVAESGGVVLADDNGEIARAVNLGQNEGVPAALARDIFEAIRTETNRAVNGQRAVSEGLTGQGVSILAARAMRIDHVAIAVRDLDAAITEMTERFGFTLRERNRVSGGVSGMAYAVVSAGAAKLVLCEGDSDRSNVTQYIEHYGPGVQHVAIELDDADAALGDLRERGCDLLTGVIRGPGLNQIFTRRDGNSGMQFEFISRADNEGFASSSVAELFDAMEREGVY